MIRIPYFFTGIQDDSSKALGSALTYSERYFLLKFFNIPTDDDDPDKFEEKHYSSTDGQKMPKEKINPAFETFKDEMRKLYKEMGKEAFFAKLGWLGYEQVDDLKNESPQTLGKILKEMIQV